MLENTVGRRLLELHCSIERTPLNMTRPGIGGYFSKPIVMDEKRLFMQTCAIGSPLQSLRADRLLKKSSGFDRQRTFYTCPEEQKGIWSDSMLIERGQKDFYEKAHAAIHVISHGCSHVRPKFSSGIGFTGEFHGNRQSAKNCKGLCSEFPI